MTDSLIIKKNDYLDIVNLNKSNIDIEYIHPLINYYSKDNLKKENSYILPQYIDNKFYIINEKDTVSDNIIINSDVSDSSSDNLIQDKKTDPLLYFTLPINSNNFLEIVFDITNLSQLNQWINLIDNTEIDLLDFVLNLYWKNYYNKIDEDLDNFIIVNKKIFKKFLNKDLNNDIIVKIINRLIKNNYGKKIKYISKIKKYLIKYI
jgi:hypothetical protein